MNVEIAVVAIVALGIVLLFRVPAAAAAVVRVEANVHSQVKTAASRLEEYLSTLSKLPPEARVVVAIAKGSVPEAGDEGYAIRSASDTTIQVAANTAAGAANGIYGMMMAARTRQLPNPFAEKWNVTESPRWQDRRVAVASYVMGMTRLTPDMWTFPDWKEYIDFIRQFNINRLTIMGLHMYHPDVPETYQNQWRLDNYKRVIAYAHEQGMKVNLLTCYNQAPAALYWLHPEWRTAPIPGYFGQALCWSKAKDVILKYLSYSIDYLEGLDGVEVMVTEPLGWCLCDGCRPDIAAVWIDAVKELRTVLRKNNPDGEIVFWNWLLGYLPALKGVYPPTTKVENLGELQRTVLHEMPRDVMFIDLSRNQLRISHGEKVDAPELIEILEAGPKQGYRTINYMFFMDREFGMLDRASIFPKPFLDMTVDEFEYTKSMPVSGVCSYRLAPPGRFLSDFFFMRKAWNPDLTREQLLDEAAGYLTPNAEHKRKIAGAIEKIERYWHDRKRDDLLAARDTFESVAQTAAGKDLLRIRDGLVILAMVDDYARTAKEFEDVQKQSPELMALLQRREEKLIGVYLALKQYPLYQGLTTEGFWEPRSVTMLVRPNMDMWANYINYKKYYD